MCMKCKKKGGIVNIVPPTPSNFNKDVRANAILKTFNDIKDKKRMEVTSFFDLHNNGTATIPSVTPEPGKRMKNSAKTKK